MPPGHTLGGNNVDSYGVDHSGFTTRDEVAYQTARQQRENRIMQNYHNQGITQDYPQYGTDFWGSLPENNYGFGASNITPNVENMQNTPVLENVINYLKQYKIITDKKLSDVNKHQYMSCLAGKDGIALGLTGLALGVGKEVTDLTRKYFNEEQKKAYGGWSGIWSDSLKDMNNNIKGFAHGFVDNQPCYPLLKKPLP